MKTLYLQAMGVGVVLALSGTAFAQQPPQDPPANSPPPAQTPFPGRTVQTPPGFERDPVVSDEPWSFALGANGAYEGNALFTGPSEDKQFSHSLYASLGRSWRLRRGDAQFGLTATQAFYQDTASLNDFRYSLVGGLGHKITRRLTWSGNVSLSSGLARDSQVLTDDGIVLPSTTTARTSTGASTFSYALTRESNLSWSLTTSGVGFSAAAFNGGTQLTTTGTYSRSVGRSQTVGASVDYSRSFDADLSSDVYGVFGTWSYSTTGGWVVTASGGVRPYSVPTENALRLTSAFAGGVTKPVRRNQTIGVMYSKSVEQTFGVNRANNLVQSVTANYGITLRRNLTASFAGTLAQSQDPQDADLSVLGQVAQGSLSYQVLRNLSISFGSSYYSRGVSSADRVTSTSTSLAVSYNTSW
jgi:hypothetical protein